MVQSRRAARGATAALGSGLTLQHRLRYSFSPALVDRRAAGDGLPVTARKSKHHSLRLCCRPGCRRPFAFDFDLRQAVAFALAEPDEMSLICRDFEVRFQRFVWGLTARLRVLGVTAGVFASVAVVVAWFVCCDSVLTAQSGSPPRVAHSSSSSAALTRRGAALAEVVGPVSGSTKYPMAGVMYCSLSPHSITG